MPTHLPAPPTPRQASKPLRILPWTAPHTWTRRAILPCQASRRGRPKTSRGTAAEPVSHVLSNGATRPNDQTWPCNIGPGSTDPHGVVLAPVFSRSLMAFEANSALHRNHPETGENSSSFSSVSFFGVCVRFCDVCVCVLLHLCLFCG